MALPSSGSLTAAMINVELGRASNAPFSLGGAAERALAGKASGPITFQDFLGKASEIVKTLPAGSGPITLQSLFTGPEWASATPKRVILASGSERGSLNPAQAAVSIGAAWTGTLSLDVAGIISGAPGAANGGTGGTALDANVVGASGQKLQVNLTGTIRSGGGGGGLGGKGGAGTYVSTIRDPVSGEYYSTSGGTAKSWTVFYPGYGNVYWNNTSVYYDPTPTQTSVNVGGYTYFRGTKQVDGGGGNGYYGIYRTQNTNVGTTGGDGGAGGAGQGYQTAYANGSSGAAGGTNAGAGGTGGRGGNFGSDGTPGSTGAAGNAGVGLSGASGGLAGFAIANIANATLTNNGTLLGRT